VRVCERAIGVFIAIGRQSVKFIALEYLNVLLKFTE